MNTERMIRIIAGSFVLISLALGVSASPLFVSEYWLWFTAFVGANLLQSGFTCFCPMETILKKLGFHNVDMADDGVEAFRMLREAKDYGLVISDLTMRAMSGLELLKSIRADADLQGVKFIMVTGHNDTQSVVAAKGAGVNGYIVKPFNIDALRQRLRAVLGPLPAPAAPLAPLRA